MDLSGTLACTACFVDLLYGYVDGSARQENENV
jgi:hypothetical protein